MFEDIVEQIVKSYKYSNYNNMTFLSSFLYSHSSKYKILLPISLYYTGEYTKALSFFIDINTPTSLYYKYLCYNKLKEYTNALACLKKLISDDFNEDVFDLEIFLVNKNDKEYFYNDMALLHTQLYEREEAIRFFKLSYSIFPIFNTIENLHYENELKECLCKPNSNFKLKENKRNGFSKSKTSLDEFVFDISSSENKLEKYSRFIPGIGSYALAFYAKNQFDLGLTESCKKLFYMIKHKDPKFLYNMDYFSTALWNSPDITELGILCKNLILDSPNSSITWKALGNYYNHKNDYKRSILCLKRSLYIENDAYTLNLLGFESVYKNEYMEALDYFKKSTLMLKNNYKSLYGCALVYDKIDKKSTADFYFKKCLFNNQLRVMGMKFYIKHGELDIALQIYKNALNFDSIDVNRLVKQTIDKNKKYDDIEEFLILEFVEILANLNLLDFAREVLSVVEYRGDTFYKKKEIVYEKKHAFI